VLETPVENSEPVSLPQKPSHGAQWSRNSWKLKTAQQVVAYVNPEDLNSTCALLSRLPELVSPADIESARVAFQDVALGKGFIVQGGDCAESFSDATYESVEGHLSLLAMEAATLSKAMGDKPVYEVGRIAGQYAKPRSSPIEKLSNGELVPTFRGENINSSNPKQRAPDSDRLVLGYIHASKRLEFISQIRHARSFEEKAMKPFFTSHEALHLPLESAFTKGRYNTSANMLWIGARTGEVDGAHVEYVRGLRNPIGVKVSATTRPEAVVEMLDILCPNKAESYGRVVLITRLGADKVEQSLPDIVSAVQASGHKPVWLCDPCHGNTETTVNGQKTRRSSTMLRELQATWIVHRNLNNHMGGIHLEQAGELVTECIDQVRVTEPHHLHASYKTLCDPRLAKDQALSMVLQFADFISSHQN
jgi:3-deoxy-7-phosphoheptulonate synthase